MPGYHTPVIHPPRQQHEKRLGMIAGTAQVIGEFDEHSRQGRKSTQVMRPERTTTVR